MCIGHHIEQQYWFDWDNINHLFAYSSDYGKHDYYAKNLYLIQDKTYRVKWQYDVPLGTQGKWDLLAKLSTDTIAEAKASGRYVEIDPWWDANWNYFKAINVNYTYIDTPIDNFPLRINSTNATMIALCDGGNSVRFVSTDNTTEYAYEIERWTASGFDIWVNVSDVMSNTTNTTFLMYYNNSGASDNQDVTGTWDSNFVAVYHLNQASGTVIDSKYTSNGTNSGCVYNIDGVVATCMEKDDNADYVGLGKHSSLNITGDISVECWALTISTGSYVWLASRDWDAEWELYWANNPETRLYRNEVKNADTNIVLAGSVWQYIVATENGASTDYYDNGSLSSSNAATAGGTQGDDIEARLFARGSGYAYASNHYLDEVRISNIARNATYVSLVYHNILNTTGLISWGDQTAPPPPPPIPAQNYSDPVPANNSVDICPCDGSMCITVSNSEGNNMNVTFYMSHYPDKGFYTYSNGAFHDVGNGTYCFSMTDYANIHWVGFRWTQLNVTAINVIRTIVWEDIHNEGFTTINDRYIHILYNGHYNLNYWVTVEDNSTNPLGHAIAIGLRKTLLVLDGSYREKAFLIQNESITLAANYHDEFEVNANLSFDFISNSTNISLRQRGTWWDNTICAYGTIEKTDSTVIEYNKTYYWYVEVTDFEDKSVLNNSAVFQFTTAQHPDNCTATSTESIAYSSEPLGILALIMATLCYMLLMRKRRKR